MQHSYITIHKYIIITRYDLARHTCMHTSTRMENRFYISALESEEDISRGTVNVEKQTKKKSDFVKSYPV